MGCIRTIYREAIMLTKASFVDMRLSKSAKPKNPYLLLANRSGLIQYVTKGLHWDDVPINTPSHIFVIGSIVDQLVKNEYVNKITWPI
jgi:hypothetical protein